MVSITAQYRCVKFVFGPCFAMQYLESFLVLQPSRLGIESGCFYFDCIPFLCVTTVKPV